MSPLLTTVIAQSLLSVAVTLASVKDVPEVVVNVWSVEFNTGAVVSGLTT